jgi:hypothetical protein
LLLIDCEKARVGLSQDRTQLGWRAIEHHLCKDRLRYLGAQSALEVTYEVFELQFKSVSKLGEIVYFQRKLWCDTC